MKNIKIKLDKNEQEIEKYLSSSNSKEISLSKKNELKDIADNYLHKSEGISLRMKASDIQRIKVKAIEKGLTYQTLIASVMHQYAHDKIKLDI